MNEMEHVSDLTAAYALKALSADEARAVEAHCAQCAECAADLSDMTGIASVLPLACDEVAPAADLKSRILAQARADARAASILRKPVRTPSQWSWWQAAAAAIFVAATAVGASALVDHERMVAQMDGIRVELAANKGAIAEIASAKRVWDMSGGTKQHWWHCTLVQPANQKVAMLVASMPVEPKGKTFQAWIIRRDGMHNAGLVPAGTTSMMHLPMPVHSGDVIAFTVESIGGSATPTMPVAMEQRLD